MSNPIQIDANALSGKMSKGEPCNIFISCETIAWIASVGGWRIDLGTTGGVIHLIFVINDFKPDYDDFKPIGSCYRLEEDDYDDMFEKLKACLNKK